jgi:tetratricopeptide (TPR) repeat protein
MSEPSLREEESLESLVARVADEFAERQKRGERPDVEEYAARYPGAAGTLRRVLAALELVGESLAGGGEAESGDDGVSGTLGDFRIVGQVGRGGMGLVYEAEQLSLRRRVALKVLPFASTLDPKRLLRFKNEALAAASLHHEHIAPVYAVGCERGMHYYAMQFIDGRTLAQVIAARGKPGEVAVVEGQGTVPYRQGQPGEARPSEETVAAASSTVEQERGRAYHREVARLGVEAAEALEHAHALGVVHRDVKPGNLMIDGRGKLWVTDFGLARIGDESGVTISGDLLGTLRYMSPEQALARHGLVDHRTDVYSLGVTLYELLTLRPAVGGKDRQEILRNIAFEESIAPRRLEPALPVDLETVVLKAMAKNPLERYATAWELADDLKRFLEDRPIVARRPSLVQRAGKWARRHRAVVTTAALGLLAVLSLAAAGLGWVARDRYVRQAQTESLATEALAESRRWQKEGNWPEALSAARRASALAAGGVAAPALRQRLGQRVAELTLILTLQDVRQDAAALTRRAGGFDNAGADRAYGRAFRRFGIDVDELSTEEAAGRLGEGEVGEELAAALVDWAMRRKRAGTLGRWDWRDLLALASAVDPDERREQVRRALASEDRRALLGLAQAQGVLALPPSVLAVLGMALRESGALAEGVALLRRAQREHPGDFWITFELAVGLYMLERHKPDQALHYYAAAQALRPHSVVVLFNVACIHGDKGEREEAIRLYHRALRLDPTYHRAHNNLGAELAEQGKLDEALPCFREAIRLEPAGVEAHHNLANVLAELGKVDEAIAHYHETIRLEPNYPHAHYHLGRVLFDQGKFPEAAASHREAIRLRPDHAQAHNSLGNALTEQGRLDEGIASYREAIRLQPEFAGAHQNLARALQKQGKFGEASATAREAIRLKPDFPAALNILGNALKAQGKLEEAVACYRQAICLKPGFAVAHYNLGFALRTQGDLEGAIACYRQALQHRGDYTLAYTNLGFALAMRGDLDEALVCFQKTLCLDPHHPGALTNLRTVLAQLGDLDRAIGCAEQAVRLHPEDPLAHCALGELLRDSGRFAEGLEALRHGHELGSKQPRWPYPSAEWVGHCERLVQLDRRLPALLAGKERPASPAECVEFAAVCRARKLQASAAQMYRQALEASPELAADPGTFIRCLAAQAAALAGTGRGADAGKLGEAERARWRQQALDWLRADLAVHAGQVRNGGPAAAQARRVLAGWQRARDLAEVRDESALARLDDAERQAWSRLWAEVDRLANVGGRSSGD